MILDGQLPGAQVPPHVGIGHAAGGHDEQTEGEDKDEHAASLEKFFHRIRGSYLIEAGCRMHSDTR